MIRSAAAVWQPTGDAPRGAVALPAAAMGLLLAVKVSWCLYAGGASQVPFVVALFVLPACCACPGGRRCLSRYRWPVLAGQALLTWVPFALFGGRWIVGLGGLLAGLVLLMLSGRASWLLAGLLLAADVTVRTAVTGLEFTPAWTGVLWSMVTFIDDGLWFFGMVRLAQIVGEVDQARSQSAELAVAHERLQAEATLQAVVGERLTGIADLTAAARRALSGNATQARVRIQEAGAAARQAVARAREVAAAARPGQRGPEPAGEASIGSRLAWGVLVAVLFAYNAQGISNIVLDQDGVRRGASLAVSYLLTTVLQVRHSWAARQGTRPRAWPLTLTLQAVLAYLFFLPQPGDFMTLAPFLAGSVLLLVRGWWRWTGYAAVVATWSALYATVPLRGFSAADRGAFLTVYYGAVIALVGLVVYGLSWLAGLARELRALRGELTWTAALRERLRVARDIHDLLGLGLSAIALKADLIDALIGRDDARAAAEIAELGRICATAQADIRRVTGARARLSLADEAATAEQILASVGIKVRADIRAGAWPAVADEVLAPVLREAVTNILRHTAATACAIELNCDGLALRLQISNDGVTGCPGRPGPAQNDAGHGLVNLTARVHAAGGELVTATAGDRFELTAEIPVYDPPPSGRWPQILAGARS